MAPRDAMALQARLALRCAHDAGTPELAAIRLVLGVDVAYSRRTDRCYAAAVVWDIHARAVVEERCAASPSAYPYVPGLLSFREIPALLPALRQVRSTPDAILCDSQGLAHPRRFGLARHLGWLYGLPAAGCAKSRLIGEYENPGLAAGSWSDLRESGEKIGEAARTRFGVKPVFISPGHRMTFERARQIVFACAGRFRLPEPTRLAHAATARAYRAAEFA